MGYEDFCFGCRAGEFTKRFCFIRKHNDDGSCPCAECIVKVTCENVCDDRREWLDILLKETIIGRGRIKDGL